MDMRVNAKWCGVAMLTIVTFTLYGQHGLGCLCSSCQRARAEGRAEAQAQNIPSYSVTFTEVRPPRNPLEKGIDIAMSNVKRRGLPLNLRNVITELERMQDVNDVELPYGYDSSMKFRSSISGNLKGIKTRKWLSPEQAKKKAAFEKWVARKIDMAINGGKVLTRLPQPRDYGKRDDFIKAYVEYKMSMVDNEIIEQYSKKIGGLDDYKRTMRSEASVIWQQSKR